jgi:excisionase family DNA binding protein
MVGAPARFSSTPGRGRHLQVYATPMQGEGFYTVEEAAQALKLTPDRIRQMLRDGELEGVSPQESGASGWKIPIRVIHGRERPAPTYPSESPTRGPEGIRGRDEPSPPPAQPQRDDAAENSREPAAPSTHHVTVQEAARILQTSVDILLEAKDETIADLRDRVAFLERQLEDRAEEIRRRDHIIAALTERIPPAIEAPDHEKSPRTREGTVEEPARVTPPGADGPREEGSRRPWWRRAFRR